MRTPHGSGHGPHGSEFIDDGLGAARILIPLFFFSVAVLTGCLAVAFG